MKFEIDLDDLDEAERYQLFKALNRSSVWLTEQARVGRSIADRLDEVCDQLAGIPRDTVAPTSAPTNPVPTPTTKAARRGRGRPRLPESIAQDERVHALLVAEGPLMTREIAHKLKQTPKQVYASLWRLRDRNGTVQRADGGNGWRAVQKRNRKAT